MEVESWQEAVLLSVRLTQMYRHTGSLTLSCMKFKFLNSFCGRVIVASMWLLSDNFIGLQISWKGTESNVPMSSYFNNVNIPSYLYHFLKRKRWLKLLQCPFLILFLLSLPQRWSLFWNCLLYFYASSMNVSINSVLQVAPAVGILTLYLL